MSVKQTIRLLVVDAHNMVRKSITALLEQVPDFDVFSEPMDINRAVTAAQEIQPHIVLIDISLEPATAFNMMQIIRHTCWNAQVVALGNSNDTALIQRAFQAGSIAYLAKSVSIDELSAVIRQAHAGKTTVSPDARAALLSDHAESPIGFNLSAYEREILGYMAQGRSNAQIAEKLGISISTVKNHNARIFHKLNVNNRLKAVALAIQHQIVDKKS